LSQKHNTTATIFRQLPVSVFRWSNVNHQTN